MSASGFESAATPASSPAPPGLPAACNAVCRPDWIAGIGSPLRGVVADPLLLLCATLLFILYLTSLWLPQLPGELRTETSAAQRWLAATDATFGGASQLLLSLGFFDLLHGVVFQLLLGAISFCCCCNWHRRRWLQSGCAVYRAPWGALELSTVRRAAHKLASPPALAPVTFRNAACLGEPCSGLDGGALRAYRTQDHTRGLGGWRGWEQRTC